MTTGLQAVLDDFQQPRVATLPVQRRSEGAAYRRASAPGRPGTSVSAADCDPAPVLAAGCADHELPRQCCVTLSVSSLSCQKLRSAASGPNETRHVCACRWLQRRPDDLTAVRVRLAGQKAGGSQPIYMPPLVRWKLRIHSHGGRVFLHESGAGSTSSGSSRTEG